MHVTNKNEILSFLKDIKPELRANGIEKIGIFGSFARDSADLLSDIDIVIKTSSKFLKKHKDIKAFLFLEELRNKIKDKFYREVDICDEQGLKDKKILDEAIYA